MSFYIGLFETTGQMAEPWVAAGHKAICFDTQNKNTFENGIHYIKHDLTDVPGTLKIIRSMTASEGIVFVAAFPPCDHLATSGAAWFKGKGLRALSKSIELVACASEMCEQLGAPYILENPVSTLSTYWRKSDYWFHPYHYTQYCAEDNYTKKTNLWAGHGFKMPEKAETPGIEIDKTRIRNLPQSKNRANIRSKTPKGFAYAVWKANDNGF